MPEDTFDTRAAGERQRGVIEEVQRIRDAINREVIDYYYDLVPQNEEEDARHRDGIRSYLRAAVEDIDALLGRMT